MLLIVNSHIHIVVVIAILVNFEQIHRQFVGTYRFFSSILSAFMVGFWTNYHCVIDFTIRRGRNRLPWVAFNSEYLAHSWSGQVGLTHSSSENPLTSLKSSSSPQLCCSSREAGNAAFPPPPDSIRLSHFCPPLALNELFCWQPRDNI